MFPARKYRIRQYIQLDMESQLPQRLRERTRKLEDANQTVRQSEQMLATELQAAQRLQHVATQLINTRGTQALYEQILDTAMALLHSDFASIQMFYPERGTNGELRLLGHRGFSPEATKRWEWVRSTTRTTCGEALRTGRRIAVPDIRNCDFMSGSEDLDGYLGAEIHAGQTTPLVSRSGDLLGMVSTYWREPHELAPSEIAALDVLARMAADLIERSQAEEKLRKSEERLRASEQRLILAQKAAHLGVCEWDLRTNVLTHSEEYARLYGLAPDHPPLGVEELLKRTHPDDREVVQASIKNALERTQAWDTEYRVLWPDGSVHWLHSKGAVFPDALGRPVSSTGVILDITERKRAEAALRQRELQYRDLFEHMNEGIAYCKMIFENGIGSDFIYLAVNPQFEALTGLTDVIGKRATEVLPFVRDLDPSAFEDYGRVAQTGVPVRFERFLNVFQQWFAMSAYCPERGFVCLVFDVITERKRLERIAEANRKEVQALAARLMTAQEDERRRVSRELHDGMCQELGSLAIEIGNIAAHLPSREDVPSQLRALQARVVKASVEARNIAYQLRPPELDLGLPIALQDLCNQFAERAPGIALEFTSDDLPESVPLEVTSCVYRVAQESLYNSVTHSRAKNASLILTWRQGAIELTVADDGDGFDYPSIQGKGGLGLIGMEERARLVNGKLTIMSQPGSGTRIALDVPLPLPAL